MFHFAHPVRYLLVHAIKATNQSVAAMSRLNSVSAFGSRKSRRVRNSYSDYLDAVAKSELFRSGTWMDLDGTDR